MIYYTGAMNQHKLRKTCNYSNSKKTFMTALASNKSKPIFSMKTIDLTALFKEKKCEL